MPVPERSVLTADPAMLRTIVPLASVTFEPATVSEKLLTDSILVAVVIFSLVRARVPAVNVAEVVLGSWPLVNDSVVWAAAARVPLEISSPAVPEILLMVNDVRLTPVASCAFTSFVKASERLDGFSASDAKTICPVTAASTLLEFWVNVTLRFMEAISSFSSVRLAEVRFRTTGADDSVRPSSDDSWAASIFTLDAFCPSWRTVSSYAVSV